jgi:hypothetical protein
MTYDLSFAHVRDVEQMLERMPRHIGYAGMSPEVRDLYFDVCLYRDAIIGYASWYRRKRMPKTIAETAFIPPSVWERLENLELRAKYEADRAGIQKARELADFTSTLCSLMFLPA